MGAENIFMARDLLYLTGVLIGIALGFIISLFRRYTTLRRHNHIISLVICIFSLVIITFAAMLISAGIAVLVKGSFLIVTGVFIILSAAAVCFPRAVAFPLILLGGLIAVWIGFSFQRFPRISPGENLASFYRTGGGVFSAQITGGAGRGTGSLELGDEALSLRFTADVIRFNEAYPLIGGIDRGMVAEIRHNDRPVFTAPELEQGILKFYYTPFLSAAGSGPLGLSFRKCHGDLSMELFPPGVNFVVFFDGETLAFGRR
jgi:hypothetical protein